MSQVDLSALLSKPAADVAPPKPLPDGIYLFQVEDHEAKVAGQNNNTVLEVNVTCLQALEVSTPLEEGELPKKRRLSFWLTPDSLYRLKEFMEGTLQIEGGGKTLMDMVPEMKGRLFKGMVAQTTYTPKGKTESRIIDNITETYAAQ
jgi:hypothetical protein